MFEQDSTGPFAEPTGDTSGIDADALMDSIESTGSAPERQVSERPERANAEPSPAQQISELEFTWNGKQVKAPFSDPRIKQWASQGYDYAQRMADFNRERADFEAQQSKLKQSESRYRPVEEYIEKNPQWWQHVNAEWQKIQAGQSQGLPADQAGNNPALAQFEQKLSQVEKFIQSQQEAQAKAQASQEDAALDQEIRSIRESHADLDWSATDQSGKTLELRVLEHAQANKIGSFKAAFKDMMHDELMKRAEARGKESVVKERQKQTKLGLLGKSPAPKQGITDAQDRRNKSYDQLFAEGLEELGLSG